MGYRSNVIRDVPSVPNMERRLEGSRKLFNWLKDGRNANVVRLFSDEKLFIVDAVLNRQHVRYLTNVPVKLVDPKLKYNFVCKNPLKVMVLGIVGSDGQKCPVIIMKEKEKVTSEVYQHYLRKTFLPWVREAYPDGNYVLQQDGASYHTSNSTAQFLREEEVPFWEKSMWPPSSPDLNPLDYAIWSYMARRVNNKRHSNMDSLKRTIRKVWKEMEEEFIISITGKFRSRVERVLEGEGEYLAH